MSHLRTIASTKHARLLAAVLLIMVGLLYFTRAYGAVLPDRSLTLSDNQPSATATYKLGFALPSAETIGSVELQICANNPLFDEPCTVPDGFDISAATLASQSGETGFTISGATTGNVLVLTRTPALSSAPNAVYELDNVTNPSAPGSYYGRLQTYASTDATGPENDHGGLAFSINNALNVSATVPPYLLFCGGVEITGYDCGTATGNYLNFGTLTATTTKSAETHMLVATNADTGYAIRVSGSTLTSGNNIIEALTSADVSRPGVSQFGLNLANNTTPAVGANPQGPGTGVAAAAYSTSDYYRFVSGDTIASAVNEEDYRKYTVSYIVNITKNQPIGVYVTTLSYICLANF